ncbi:MAG: signal peptidase I [Acetatifactor sp.]|nr:signal peptidase I [Acetatifactor sp.]
MKKKVMKELLDTGLYLLFVLLVTWLLITFVIQKIGVEGSSMESTLYNGDALFVDKISYRFHDPERFDSIVFPFQENVYYIKRIIGLPGETVQIDESGNIYIDGEILRESYGREIIKQECIGRAAEPIELGVDEYFVMGDNRNNSKDSRTEVVGNIHKEDIFGRAWVRIWPLDSFGVLKHQ